MMLMDKIAQLRRSNGWSQEELAEKLDVSRQSISKWESAQSVPDLSRVIRMAELFGVSTDYLLKDELESLEPVESMAASGSSARLVTMEEAKAALEACDWDMLDAALMLEKARGDLASLLDRQGDMDDKAVQLDGARKAQGLVAEEALLRSNDAALHRHGTGAHREGDRGACEANLNAQ